MKITNVTNGPRGFNAVSGPILLDCKATVEAKVYEREQEHIEATGWFKTSGSYEPNPVAAGESAAPAAPLSKKEEAASAKRIAELEGEVADLATKLAAAEAKLASAGQGEPSALVAKHAGGGAYFIMDGDEKVSESMSKADAEEFNAMSDEDKAAFVKKA